MVNLKVDKENADVCYNDKYHIYWDKHDLFTYISATTIIGLYEQEFDKLFWLQYKAFQRLCNPNKDMLSNIRELGIFDRKTLSEMFPIVGTKEFDDMVATISGEWKKENKRACDDGTKIHAWYEDKFNGNGTYDLSWYGFNGGFKYKEGCYEITSKTARQAFPEMLVSMKTKSGVRIAGQIDLAVQDKDNIHILDYKSSKVLNYSSYKKPNGSHTMMKEPLSHLMDCNMSHYQMQLSLYQYMLTRIYPWLVPNDLTIIHLSNGTFMRHVVKYLRRDVVNMCCNFRDFHQDYEYTKIIKDEQGRYWLPRRA